MRQQMLVQQGISLGDVAEGENDDQRGISLMDEHLSKKRPSTDNIGSDGKKVRVAFDRERDLLSHNRMDAHKVSQLVEKARELNSRFDKSGIQKSFL